MGSGWAGNVGFINDGTGGGSGGGDEDYHTEYRNITAAEVFQQYLVLELHPQHPDQVEFTFTSGTSQVYGIDFTVTSDNENKRLSWYNLNMSQLIELGDRVIIKYPIVS